MAAADENGVPYDGIELDLYLRKLDDDALRALKLDTLEDINRIKAQIHEAHAQRHANNKWADPEWYSRVNKARGTMGYRMTCIGAEEQRRKREHGKVKKQEGVTWERAFVIAAQRGHCPRRSTCGSWAWLTP